MRNCAFFVTCKVSDFAQSPEINFALVCRILWVPLPDKPGQVLGVGQSFRRAVKGFELIHQGPHGGDVVRQDFDCLEKPMKYSVVPAFIAFELGSKQERGG